MNKCRRTNVKNGSVSQPLVPQPLLYAVCAVTTSSLCTSRIMWESIWPQGEGEGGREGGSEEGMEGGRELKSRREKVFV